MEKENRLSCKPIGFVQSKLKNLEECPLQEFEGAPDAILEIDVEYMAGLEGITAGSELVLLTWLNRADRSVLKCHVRNETHTPKVGVFTTRSPDRPNPIGLHQVKVLEILSPQHLKVFPLEVLDETPVIDIKPVFKADS